MCCNTQCCLCFILSYLGHVLWYVFVKSVQVVSQQVTTIYNSVCTSITTYTSSTNTSNTTTTTTEVVSEDETDNAINSSGYEAGRSCVDTGARLLTAAMPVDGNNCGSQAVLFYNVIL